MGNKSRERGHRIPMKHNAISLEVLPRPSVRAKKKLHRSSPMCANIRHEIHNGTFECIICYENIDEQSRIWHCGRCWGIYHYRCVQDWASRKRHQREEEASVRFNQEWLCPSCRDVYRGPPQLMCWCMATDGTLNPPNSAFNSCGDRCEAVRRSCLHLCDQICHPGPCGPCTRCRTKIEGIPNFAQKHRLPSAVPPPSINYRPPGIPQPAHERSRGIEPDPERRPAVRPNEVQTYSASTFTPLIFCVVWTIFVAFCTYCVTKVIIEPYNHPGIVENEGSLDALWIFFASAALLSSCMNASSMRRVESIRRVFVHNTMIRPFWISLKSRGRDDILAYLIVKIITLFFYGLYIFTAVVWIFGPSLFASGVPSILRFLEFRGVCDGFDTRVHLDRDQKILQNPVFLDLTPETLHLPYTLTIVDLRRRSPSKTTLELNHYDPVNADLFGIPDNLNSSSPPSRQTVYTDPGTHEISTHSHSQSTTSQEPNADDFSHRKFPAVATKAIPVDTSESPGVYRILFDWDAGTWTTQIGPYHHNFTTGTFHPTSDGQHLLLPSLHLHIPHYTRYAHHCHAEPFLKVHRVPHNRVVGDRALLAAQANEPYRTDNGDVVLRTASFGASQTALEVCARRKDRVVDGAKGKDRVREGLEEFLPVVVGLIAVLRFQVVVDTNYRYRISCQDNWI